jgi:hypothetical protein
MCADRGGLGAVLGGLGGGDGDDDDDEEDDEEDDDTTHFESTPNVWDSLDPLIRDSLEDLHTPSDLHTSSERVAAGVLGTARDGGGAHRSPQAPSRASFPAPHRAPIEPKEANGLLQGALSMYTWHAVSSAIPAPGTAPSAPAAAAAAGAPAQGWLGAWLGPAGDGNARLTSGDPFRAVPGASLALHPSDAAMDGAVPGAALALHPFDASGARVYDRALPPPAGAGWFESACLRKGGVIWRILDELNDETADERSKRLVRDRIELERARLQARRAAVVRAVNGDAGLLGVVPGAEGECGFADAGEGEGGDEGGGGEGEGGGGGDTEGAHHANEDDEGAHDGADEDDGAYEDDEGAHDGAHQDERTYGRWSGYVANLVTLEIPTSAVAGESLVVPSELSDTGYVEVTRCDEMRRDANLGMPLSASDYL